MDGHGLYWNIMGISLAKLNGYSQATMDIDRYLPIFDI